MGVDWGGAARIGVAMDAPLGPLTGLHGWATRVGRHRAWRILLGVGGIPAALLLVLLVLSLPESPIWLKRRAVRDRANSALAVTSVGTSATSATSAADKEQSGPLLRDDRADSGSAGGANSSGEDGAMPSASQDGDVSDEDASWENGAAMIQPQSLGEYFAQVPQLFNARGRAPFLVVVLLSLLHQLTGESMAACNGVTMMQGAGLTQKEAQHAMVAFGTCFVSTPLPWGFHGTRAGSEAGPLPVCLPAFLPLHRFPLLLHKAASRDSRASRASRASWGGGTI